MVGLIWNMKVIKMNTLKWLTLILGIVALLISGVGFGVFLKDNSAYYLLVLSAINLCLGIINIRLSIFWWVYERRVI